MAEPRFPTVSNARFSLPAGNAHAYPGLCVHAAKLLISGLVWVTPWRRTLGHRSQTVGSVSSFLRPIVDQTDFLYAVTLNAAWRWAESPEQNRATTFSPFIFRLRLWQSALHYLTTRFHGQRRTNPASASSIEHFPFDSVVRCFFFFNLLALPPK